LSVLVIAHRNQSAINIRGSTFVFIRCRWACGDVRFRSAIKSFASRPRMKQCDNKWWVYKVFRGRLLNIFKKIKTFYSLNISIPGEK
jgi:hypothetical protein